MIQQCARCKVIWDKTQKGGCVYCRPRNNEYHRELRARRKAEGTYVVRKKSERDREQQKTYKAIYNQRPDVKIRQVERQRRMRSDPSYRVKIQARIDTWSAIKRGELVRPDHCENCRSRDRISAHHDDYSKPLEVRWLCVPCHKFADALLKRNGIAELEATAERHAAAIRKGGAKS